jgi:hypothetical protein
MTMPSRIRIEEDGNFAENSIENLSDDHIIRSGSLRRLRGASFRGSHYYGSQRASIAGDILPLISNSQRPARTSFPSFPPLPPSTYQPQPHQLIAVCFNHMSGRQCEHCQQLNRELGGINANESNMRVDRSLDSTHTLGHEHEHGQQHLQEPRSSSGSEPEEKEKPNDGGEKGGNDGPPAPVGIWDKRMGKLRLEVLGLWARTSESPRRLHL